MSRPRKITDEEVVEAVAGLIVREGPGALTFASAAAATGLSPATLVQRYGNREALLRATLLWMWDQLDAETQRADAAHPLDPEGAVALLVRLSADYGSGEEAAQGLLLLREDFRDPVLRARGVAWNRALISALGRRLSDVPEARERLGRLMASQWQGAVLWWGFSREGTLRGRLRRELREWVAAVGVA
ncbi:TetR/AcrR family transcriptional regulator [Devosia sp.]|uniref:TetR/AcrR family transcriptional regulator n=1 Tax=Devosia sp. TaxID=1871048 RepID=UPI001AC584F2|nr:TetR/AcrR family transcriptional regulator [Devosia sp.]MBN9309430.1 TetR/AcrR family transcriptional regulator [Devosia sp.]